jgi:hypothetical protein
VLVISRAGRAAIRRDDQRDDVLRFRRDVEDLPLQLLEVRGRRIDLGDGGKAFSASASWSCRWRISRWRSGEAVHSKPSSEAASITSVEALDAARRLFEDGRAMGLRGRERGAAELDRLVEPERAEVGVLAAELIPGVDGMRAGQSVSAPLTSSSAPRRAHAR